ncbi:acylphosphatase [Fuscovulum ytuae]|uniref:Acylphosphatase n=1 Tax=Fuscovulum ytuae TaxID=3042299 RepID=A0ABY8Q647_9RHOB|nr:acylphosphatase [Fuscovulum sp. YMD61]WGV16328.1 acylphosphatase [Fuscovulum sp. YMD61]
MPSERFIIRGDLGAATFVPWVLRHMAKLGLTGGFGTTEAMQAELHVAGPSDLIDALEMGVSLGPIESWVESIERSPLNRAA